MFNTVYKLDFLSNMSLFIVSKVLIFFKTKLSTDLAAGFNLGTKRVSCVGESHVFMWFMITKRTFKNWPLNITLAFLVAAGFCVVFSCYLSIHQSCYFAGEDKNV